LAVSAADGATYAGADAAVDGGAAVDALGALDVVGVAQADTTMTMAASRAAQSRFDLIVWSSSNNGASIR